MSIFSKLKEHEIQDYGKQGLTSLAEKGYFHIPGIGVIRWDGESHNGDIHFDANAWAVLINAHRKAGGF